MAASSLRLPQMPADKADRVLPLLLQCAGFTVGLRSTCNNLLLNLPRCLLHCDYCSHSYHLTQAARAISRDLLARHDTSLPCIIIAICVGTADCGSGPLFRHCHGRCQARRCNRQALWSRDHLPESSTLAMSIAGFTQP